MRKPFLLMFACVTFVVAAKPGAPKLDYDASVFGWAAGPAVRIPGAAGEPVRRYRPCRPGPGDDNCIQLYERRVRAALPRATARPAMGGPIEGHAAYPHCSRVITDECVQLFDRAPPRPVRAPRPARRPAPPAEPSTPGI